MYTNYANLTSIISPDDVQVKVILSCSCVIQNTIICPNTIIESNCNLNNCLIGEGARVSAGSNIKNEHILLEDENM